MSVLGHRWGLISLLLCFATSLAQAQSVKLNKGLLKSTENLAASLVLTEVPLGLVGIQDAAIVKWTPASSGTLRYSAVPGGGNPANYPLQLEASALSVNAGGEIQFLGEKLPAGIHYCIIVSGSDNSTEFVVAREAEVSPRMISPRSARGAAGINTNSPTFTWEEVNGVPFYHILLSDQPFTVTEDAEGNTETEGANVIWQAITPATSMPYGTPDPSGFFTITDPPPLVKGVRYNWIVVNNYGNNPALSSSVSSGPTGFEVEVPPPFNAPTPIHPAHGSTITDDLITFQWSAVEGASLYHVYLSRLEELSGSEALLPIWDGVTSNTLFDVSSGVLQQEGIYYWKVLAQNESGNGAMTDTTRFFFSTRSARINFYTVDLQGATVPRSTLTLESVTHGTSPTVLPTDSDGWIDRLLPLGSYQITAVKEGFEDTTIVFDLQIENEVRNLSIPMRPSPSSVYGSTEDASQTALGFVTIRAVSQTSGEIKETTSDINGNFSLGLASDNWQFSASRSGYTSAAVRSLFLHPGADLNLDEGGNGGPFVLIKNTFTLSGSVVTPSGEAIWGASVLATQGNEQEQAVSNAQGQYSVTLATGDWSVSVSKDGYVSPQPQTVSIIDHNVTQNLTLIPQANIVSGTILSGGVPLADAEVLASPNSGQTVTAITDALGQYTLSLGRGSYQIVPQKTGYISPDPSQFALDVGQTLSGVDFVLQPESSFITGAVTSDGVTPLEGVLIGNGSETTTSGSNGRYTLGMLHGTYTISATKQGYLASGEQTVTLTPGQTLGGIDFLLTPNASVLTGKVTSGSLPVNAARVTARNPATRVQNQAETDQQGDFSISVTAGTYSLKASKTGFISSPDSIVVAVNPGQTIPNNDFNFVENVSHVSGLVKSGSTPLRNATVVVTAIGASANIFTTVTGVDGSFNLAVLPELSYAVTATRSGYFEQTETTATLTAGQTATVVLVLSPHQSIISGTVFAQGGSALAGAIVQASDGSSTFSTTSGATGAYTLGVDAGAFEVTAQKSGHLPSTLSLTIGVGDTTSGADFTLATNFAALDGVITDAVTGQPVATALVVATEASTQDGGSNNTGSQGHYLIQNLPAGVYSLTVTHASYLTSRLDNQVFAGGSANRIELALTPKNGRIAGQVTSAGAGIGGVTVTGSAAGVTISAVTVADGSYALNNLSPGEFTVQASLSGYTSSTPVTTQVQANSTATADFTVTPNEGTISGFVRESDVGISGAMVVAAGDAGNSGFTTTTADGSYSVSNLAVDRYSVQVNLSRYASTPDTAFVQLDPGATVSQDFTVVKSEVQVSGTVMNQAGTAMAGIVVVGESSKGRSETTTDGSGAFTLTELPGNAQYQIRTDIFEEGFENGETVLEMHHSDVSGVMLSVGVRTAKIRGEVGVSDATLTARHPVRGLTFSTSSQPDGSYLFKNLYDGDYQLAISKVGYKATPAEKSIASLGINEERPGVNFVLEEIKVNLSGVVRDGNSNALADVDVLAWSAEAQGTATTGSDGRYSITGLPPNLTYTVQTKLSALDYENASITASLGETDLTGQDLTVEVHNGTIQGAASRDTGGPVAMALVTIVELDSTTYTDNNGSYAFHHLYSGTYTLTVSKEGFGDVPPATVILAQSETSTQDFPGLSPLTSAIFGIVNDDDGRLRDVIVTVTDESTGQVARIDTTDSGGIYSIQNLEVTRLYTIEVVRKGYAPQSNPHLSLAAGSVTTDFLLTPVANSIFGLVRNKETGEIIAQAVVTVNGLAGGVWSDSTDAFGSFSVSGLLSGAYSVVAEHDGLISSSQTVELVAGGANKLTLMLENPGSVEGTVTYVGDGRAGANITATNPLSGTIVTTTSRADGGYRIRGLLNGDYTVSCVVPGFSAEPSPQAVTVTSGTASSADFTLTAENNAIIGTVTDANSGLVSGARILATGIAFRDSSSSDLNGQFQMADLADGSYQVAASLPGYSAPPAETVQLVGGQPVIVDIQLTAIQNSISGFVKNDVTGAGVPGAVVTATLAEGTTFSDTSAADGSYLFTLDTPGTYELSAAKSGFESGASIEVVLQSNSSVAQNLILTPIISLSTISGAITRRGEPVAAAEVRCLSLSDVAIRDTVMSTAIGGFIFSNLPAPAEYLLEVAQEGSPTLVSSVLELTDAGLNYDFIFASGQIRWRITRDGVTPLPNVAVRINNDTRSIELITNNEGASATEANLTSGDYFVTLANSDNTLTPARHAVTLAEDSSTVVEEIWLPFIQATPDSVPAQDSLVVEVLALSPPETTLWLNYQGVDAVAFEKTPLAPGITPARGDTMAFSAVVPAQGSAGLISYFIETEFRGRLYSNAGNPFEVVATNEGIFSRLDLTPALKSVPPGVPVVLNARAYDGINKPMAAQEISWQISEGEGEFDRFSDDSTKAWFVSDVDTTTKISVLVTVDGVVLAGSAVVVTEHRVLGTLEVNGSAVEASNREDVTFSYSAADTGGVLMSIYPIWTFAPSGSGQLVPDESLESAVFRPDSSFIGQVRLTLRDSLSGALAGFNAAEGLNSGDVGLKIFQVITESSDETQISDGEGFSLSIPAGAVEAGASLKFKLRKPQIPDVKRFTGKHSVAGQIYDILVSGAIRDGMQFGLRFPIPAGLERDRLTVGHWDVNSLSWELIASTLDDDAIAASTSHFSEFAILLAAQPLAIGNVQLRPNPFSPNDQYGLQIGFSLTSDDLRKPWVTIQIYNMAGDLVRTLADNLPMSPIEYLPGDENTLMWDGLTDGGTFAQNGRYIVRIRVRDGSGEKEVVKTVVLIK